MYSKKPYKRSERMSDEIRSILAGIFISEFQIPDAGLLTVSKVEVTSDLRLAKVFISLLDAKKLPMKLLIILSITEKRYAIILEII